MAGLGWTKRNRRHWLLMKGISMHFMNPLEHNIQWLVQTFTYF